MWPAPSTRVHVVLMPSKKSFSHRSPLTYLKTSNSSPREPADPNPWLLCWLRLTAAISEYDAPSKGLYLPTSSVITPGVSLLIVVFHHRPVLVYRRTGFATPNSRT